MKVLFINTLYAPNEVGGAERAVRVLAETLVARGDEAVVISLDPKGRHSKDTLNGVTVYYIPLANLHWAHDGSRHPAWRRALWHLINAYNPVMRARIKAILKAERPDVIEANNLQGLSVSAWGVARKLRIPVLQVLHDYYLACPNGSMFKRERNCNGQCTMCALYSIPIRLLGHIPTGVSSVSRRVLDRIEQSNLFRETKLRSIVPSAIVLNPKSVERKDKPAKSRLVVGYLGRLDPTKGVKMLLQTIASMSPNRIELLLGGKGPEDYVAALKREFPHSHIHFVGFVQPEKFFSEIDVLVVPSLWEEPMPRVIFEGFACGVPAIVSNVGGMPEIVAENETGWIFEAGSVPSLKALLQGLMEKEWRASLFTRNCRAKSVEFGIDAVFRQHYADWQQCIAGNAAHVTAASVTRVPSHALREISSTANDAVHEESV